MIFFVACSKANGKDQQLVTSVHQMRVVCGIASGQMSGQDEI